MESAAQLIERLALQPHPEGGWYREVHRSVARVDTPRGSRSALTMGPGFQFEDFRFVSALTDHAAHFTGGLAGYSTLL